MMTKKKKTIILNKNKILMLNKKNKQLKKRIVLPTSSHQFLPSVFSFDFCLVDFCLVDFCLGFHGLVFIFFYLIFISCMVLLRGCCFVSYGVVT